MSEATKALAEASAAARRDFFMLSSPKFFSLSDLSDKPRW
jgi:hypothetical protein